MNPHETTGNGGIILDQNRNPVRLRILLADPRVNQLFSPVDTDIQKPWMQVLGGRPS